MPDEVSRNTLSRSIVHGDVFQAHELHLHGNEVPHPPLTSWQDRPSLTAELEDLLHVQRDAAEALPYRLLGVKQPELTKVYVQQSVRTDKPEPERKPGERKPEPAKPEPVERVVPIEEALATGKHLLITGEPGAGKSTLGQMYVQRLASEWFDPSTDPPLPEPVMPLRIPAKALAEELSWSELLAGAVRDRRLNAPLKPEMFAKRALGARWLVFVDGLDEIAEPERRERVIDAIASRIRRGSDHRLVITTRPLPPDELRKIHGPQVELYTIQPFGPVELQAFAAGWFRAQDPTRAIARTEEFVRQVHDGRLRELVSNPLLATIAAIANTLEPRRKLPHNRVDLYERFMNYLLEDTASGRDTLADLRQSLQHNPTRLQQVEDLHANRRSLIEHMAHQRLESERPLLDIAVEWSECQRGDVLTVLAGTGLFVQIDEGLRFLHHSFAEFLAARHRAAKIPADFPDLDDWVNQGMQPARETSVLFTFALWGREPGNDLDLVFHRLTSGGLDHALLAGKLLAEEVALDEDLAEHVVNRLVSLVLSIGAYDEPWEPALKIGRVLAGLAGEPTGRLTESLHTLRDKPQLPPATRICCAVALGHLGFQHESAQWLQDFADLHDPLALRAIANGLAEILPNGAELAENILLRAEHESYVVVMAAVQILLKELERREPAARLLRGLVARMRADTSISPNSPHVPQLHGSPDEEPPGWGMIAEQAARAGCVEEALWAAERVLALPHTEVDDFTRAVEAMVACGGDTAVVTVVERAKSGSLEQVLVVGKALKVVNGELATDLIRLVATNPAVDDADFFEACQALAGAEPLLVTELVAKRATLEPRKIVAIAGELAEAGVDVDHLVRLALARMPVGRWEFGRTARLVLTLGEFSEEVYAWAGAGPPAHWAEALPLMHRDRAAELFERLVSTPVDGEVLARCLGDVVFKNVPDEAERLLEVTLEIVDQSDTAAARELVPVLHRTGRAEEAIDLAKRTFLRSFGDLYVEECAETLLKVGGVAVATFIAEQVLAANVSVARKLAVANHLAEQGLLQQAATLWCDVVRRHGDMAGKGFTAATKLVRCLYGPQAIDTVRKALAEDRLTATARANLKALEAWLVAIEAS
ncbi:NACHT domain-containing protein [Lentzea kentuckyensis]|uniref:NACHT domain-containing protein n=1 Tax=Lentzea kentuckyensis TaxID=360086 RepID=UPI000A38F643|nr:NACHT domain-containing protein [Lentzea kentuckyensis]